MTSTRDASAVFIHSTGTGPFLFAGIPVEATGAARRVFAANLGYTVVDRVPRGHLVGAADDAACVLSQIPASGPVHLIAHSYGALVALHVARALGPRVASLFFYEPVFFGIVRGRADVDAAGLEEGDAFVTHPWFLTDEERGGTEPWLEKFIDYWNRPGSWAHMPAPLRELSLTLGWKMFQEVRAVFSDPFEIDASLESLPATIVQGDKTTATSRAMSRAFHQAFLRSRFVELPGLAHMAPLTAPRRIHEEVARHLERVGLTSPDAPRPEAGASR